jgi:hypothetical protein
MPPTKTPTMAAVPASSPRLSLSGPVAYATPADAPPATAAPVAPPITAQRPHGRFARSFSIVLLLQPISVPPISAATVTPATDFVNLALNLIDSSLPKRAVYADGERRTPVTKC